MTPSQIERRIRIAGVLAGVGLLIQIGSLIPLHPLAFVVFLTLGCPLVGAGILLFLTALLAKDHSA